MDVKTSRFVSALSAIFFLCDSCLCVIPKNLALNKPSSQSSTTSSSPAYQGNDGDGATRGITDSVKPSYWSVDLGEQVNVTFILSKIEMPYDNLYIGVGDSPPTANSVPGQDFGVCKHFTEYPADWIQTIPCNLSGRYVIIFSDYAAPLRITEVEVYNTSDTGILGIGRLNLAREKTSFLSSTSSGYPAYLGTDGQNTQARTDTNVPPPAFWYVDLDERFQVTSIVLYNMGSWTNLYVGVGDNAPTSASLPGDDFGACYMFPGKQGDTMKNITCSLSGRYVIIFSDATSDLKIRELEVYGTPELEPVQKREATFELYQNRRDVMRNVKAIQYLTASTKIQCIKKCLNTKACVAFTYYGTTCRLHSERVQDYTGQEEQFVAKSGAVYMQVKDEL